MKRRISAFSLLSIVLLVAANAASARPDQMAPLSPVIAGSDWGFETNQAYQPAYSYHREMAVAADCDVNGDGYKDLLIGKRDYDSSATDNGRVWLFYGSMVGLGAAPSRTFDPPYTNTYGFFGTEVACADINDDGYADILIGMDNYDSAYPDEGAVFVWYGAADGPTVSYNWMARGNSTYAHFGFSLDSAGDVNGDGYEDIIIGAFRPDDNNIANAYFWYGGPMPDGLGASGLPSNADWVASDPHPGQANGTGFARLVRGIGDVNGDTYDDVMVSAHLYDGGINDQGAVFVYYGSASGPNEGVAGTIANADWYAVSGQESTRFAMYGADGVGDVNSDGFDDLAVGAYLYNNTEDNEGAVFVWYGGPVPGGLGENGNPRNADWRAETNTAGDSFGYAVRPAGDVNNDGVDDLIATAYGFDVPSGGGTLNGAGAWFVWYGGTGGLGEDGIPSNADMAGYGSQAGGVLGLDDCSSGDINQDGRDEIFVLSLYYTNPEQSEGAVFGYDTVRLPNYLPLIAR